MRSPCHASRMNLTLQHRNIDFDLSISAEAGSETTGGILAESSIRPLPKALRLILALWLPVWAFFLAWPVGKDPARLGLAWRLFRASSEERRATVYGEPFDQFLRFCKDRLPPDSTFRLVGVDYASIDKVRAFYVLYPRLVAAERAQFVLVYRSPGYHEDGACPFAVLNAGSFILKAAAPAVP